MVSSRKETQPKLVSPTLHGLLSLPFRICNPPPAVGKVRSCGTTALIDIKLQDVLDRKHLPPLGLKDFEEWLLYVEKCPGYLYFTLWLNEYSEKYNTWDANVKEQRDLADKYQVGCSMPSSTHIAMFYARAKQTFFMPNSSYELDLPSDVLAPFHSPDASQLPDPILFNEVSLEVRQRLEKCLDRFVQAQMTNVGSRRVLCGIIAGGTITFLTAGPPIAVNFAAGASRWSRLAALPGLWIGLTILFAALSGICVGVYVFGDLRQLHKFELDRPPISKPQHLRKEKLSISLPLTSPPPPQAPITPAMDPTSAPPPLGSPAAAARGPTPPKLTIVPPSPVHLTPDNRSELSFAPSQSSYDDSSGVSVLSSASDEERIEISAAMYDEDIIDGPATSPLTPTMNYQFPPRAKDIEIKDVVYTHTAPFIHSYEDSSVDLRYTYDIEERKLSPEERQPLSTFDFDALPEAIITTSSPCKSQSHLPPSTISATVASTTTPQPPSDSKEMIELHCRPPPLTFSYTSIMGRLQYHCNPRKWFIVSSDLAERASPTQSPRSSFGHSGHNRPIAQLPPKRHPHEDVYRIKRIQCDDVAVHKELKKISAVPPFAALTKILSPVVVRAHWEIVIRSIILAFLAAWIIVGCLLAIPPRR